MANHIIPMIVDRLVDGLTVYMIDNIAVNDPTRIKSVKSGRFQEDPSLNDLRLSVQGGDLEDPNQMDGIVDLNKAPNRVGFHVEPREIGGTQMWYRKGTVRLELFFIARQYDEETSREYAYTILGRLQNNIEKIYVADLRDDYDEHAVKLFSTQNSFFQSGGPPSSYYWRGKVLWECLTERE